MAQSEVKQEPQFAVLADHVSFTIISVDSELGQIHVDIHADELREDLRIKSWTLGTTQTTNLCVYRSQEMYLRSYVTNVNKNLT